VINAAVEDKKRTYRRTVSGIEERVAVGVGKRVKT